MNSVSYNHIGRGIYTLKEAERITEVPACRIRRWTRGYTYRYKGQEKYTPPIVASGYEYSKEAPAIDFSDLIEIRFLNAFRIYGVGWKAIRIAANKAKEILQKDHPLSSQIFKTDGRTILMEISDEAGDKVLLDLIKSQFAFERVLAPHLYTGLEYSQFDEPERWWPLGNKKSIVLDPHRQFGTPIVTKGGIPTSILYRAMMNGQSIDVVADWFEIGRNEVIDAFEYERKLAA